MLKKSELQGFIDYQLELCKRGMNNPYIKVLTTDDKIYSMEDFLFYIDDIEQIDKIWNDKENFMIYDSKLEA